MAGIKLALKWYQDPNSVSVEELVDAKDVSWANLNGGDRQAWAEYCALLCATENDRHCVGVWLKEYKDAEES